MSTVNVALLQMSPCGVDQDANLDKGGAFWRKVHDMDADIWPFANTSLMGVISLRVRLLSGVLHTDSREHSFNVQSTSDARPRRHMLVFHRLRARFPYEAA